MWRGVVSCSVVWGGVVSCGVAESESSKDVRLLRRKYITRARTYTHTHVHPTGKAKAQKVYNDSYAENRLQADRVKDRNKNARTSIFGGPVGYVHTRTPSRPPARLHARTHARAPGRPPARTHARTHARSHARTHVNTQDRGRWMESPFRLCQRGSEQRFEQRPKTTGVWLC